MSFVARASGLFLSTAGFARRRCFLDLRLVGRLRLLEGARRRRRAPSRASSARPAACARLGVLLRDLGLALRALFVELLLSRLLDGRLLVRLPAFSSAAFLSATAFSLGGFRDRRQPASSRRLRPVASVRVRSSACDGASAGRCSAAVAGAVCGVAAPGCSAGDDGAGTACRLRRRDHRLRLRHVGLHRRGRLRCQTSASAAGCSDRPSGLVSRDSAASRRRAPAAAAASPARPEYGSTSDGSACDTPVDPRRDDLRRDHDDQLGLLLLVRAALEQVAEHRDVADARESSTSCCRRCCSSGRRSRTSGRPAARLPSRCGGSTAPARGSPRADAVGEVERADLRPDLQVDQVAAEHGRREVQADAELLEHDRDGVAAAAAPARPDRDTRRRRGSSLPCR